MKFKLYIIAFLLMPLQICAQSKSTDSSRIHKDTYLITYGRNVSFDIKETTTATAFTTKESLSHRKGINPRDVLYGLISGMQDLQNQGAAWETTGDIFIRGYNTLNAKSPLILIDGLERELGQISIDEIEKITVLKDAISTALYGMRGANGVVLVTTKRGVMSKPKINFSYEFNLGRPFRTPKFVDGYTYAQALNEGMLNDGLSPRYSADELSAFRTGSNPSVYSNVDWWKESLRNYSTGNNVTFSVIGGGQYVRYFTQLNYLNDIGIFRPVADNDGYSTQLKYSKLNIRTNLDITLTRYTQLQLNIFGTFSEHNRPGATIGDIFGALYRTPSGVFPIKNDRYNWAGTTDIGDNPVAMISGTGYARSQQRNFYADMKLSQNLDALLKGLSAGVRIGLDNSAAYWDSNTRKYGYEQTYYDWENKTYSYKNLRNETALNASHSVGASKNHFNLNAFANYQRKWNRNSLKVMALYSMDKVTAKGQNKSYSFIDAIGQIHYVYDQRYLLDVSVSGSAASILRPGHRWGFFPAVGVGWLLSDEKFLKTDWLNLLKLRASYGISGRTDFANDLYMDMYGAGGTYFFGKTPTKTNGLKITQLALRDLTYEKSHKLNIGIDFRAFKKLSVAMDVFYDRRTDILVSTEGKVSSLFGLPIPKENVGVVDNRGFESDIHWTDFTNRWKYAIGGTFSFTRNKIIEQNEAYKPYEYLCRTNRRIGQIYGYVVEGIYQNQEEIRDRKVVQRLSEIRPGDLKYKDLNGDNIIDSYDQKPLGYSPFPEIYYSLDLNVEYRGVGLYALFQGTGNVSVITNTSGVYQPLSGNRTVSTEYYDNRWTPDHPQAKYPRLTSTGSVNNYSNNSLWVKNGSYLKLRTLELYYTFGKRLLSNLRYISAARCYVRAYDLWCLDRIKTMDPENMKTGHPSMRRYAIGLNLTF